MKQNPVYYVDYQLVAYSMKNIVIVLAVVAILGAGGWYYMNMGPASDTVMESDTVMVGVAPENAAITPETNGTQPSTATTFTMADLATHASAESCYSAIRGDVYDLTSWIGKHPGGDREILQLCGKDGTDKFVGKHGGSQPQEMKLDTFKIGVIAE